MADDLRPDALKRALPCRVVLPATNRGKRLACLRFFCLRRFQRARCHCHLGPDLARIVCRHLMP